MKKDRAAEYEETKKRIENLTEIVELMSKKKKKKYVAIGASGVYGESTHSQR